MSSGYKNGVVCAGVNIIFSNSSIYSSAVFKCTPYESSISNHKYSQLILIGGAIKNWSCYKIFPLVWWCFWWGFYSISK